MEGKRVMGVMGDPPLFEDLSSNNILKYLDRIILVWAEWDGIDVMVDFLQWNLP
jgi:hypothetical protein